MKVLVTGLLLFVWCYANAKEMHAWQWINDKNFSSSYSKLIVGHSLPAWAINFDGPSGLSYKSKILDIEYTVVHTCKSNDCGDKNLTVLYSVQDKSYGLFNGTTTYFMGEPRKDIKEKLLEIHQSYYKNSNLKKRLNKDN